jgi:hypothetical protein
LSHKTEIDCKELKNKKYLLKALEDLGFTYKEGTNLQTKGNYNQVADVDILVTGNGNISYNNAIGFKQQSDGSYQAIGDFYALRTKDGKNVNPEMLKCEVTSHAKEAEVNERLSALMFSMDKETRKEDNNKIEFTLMRWTD